ncbi:hypothetical protein DICVIV_14491, partial [Dictyocaulus viviparus]
MRSPHTRLIHHTPLPPPSPPPPLLPQQPLSLMSTVGVPLLPVGTIPPSVAPTPILQLMPSQISPMPMHNAFLLSPPVVPVNINYAVSAVKCFTRALQLAPGSRLEDTLRLLQLWFDYGEYNEVYKQFSENMKGLAIETWLEAIQLMARLDSRD